MFFWSFAVFEEFFDLHRILYFYLNFEFQSKILYSVVNFKNSKDILKCLSKLQKFAHLWELCIRRNVWNMFTQAWVCWIDALSSSPFFFVCRRPSFHHTNNWNSNFFVGSHNEIHWISFVSDHIIIVVYCWRSEVGSVWCVVIVHHVIW